MIIIKTETMIKVLNRYIKGLDSMWQQALLQDEKQDANHYEFDLRVLEKVRDIVIETGKE